MNNAIGLSLDLWKTSAAKWCFKLLSSHPICTAFQLSAAQTKAIQQYQLIMQQANKEIYSTTNSLTERRWMGLISMRKEEQNSTVQQLKSNLMGLGLGNYLISVCRRRTRLGRESQPDCLLMNDFYTCPCAMKLKKRAYIYWCGTSVNVL